MQRVIALLLAVMLTTSVGCSMFGKGGKSSQGSDMDSGSIPLASAGEQLLDVNFAYDSSALDAQAQSVLQTNSQWLQSNNGQNVVVEGHCDERGTEEYNLALGERRARSVFNFLRDLGVASDRMSTISYGEEIPLDPGHSEDSWSRNRRAHFALNQ